MKFPLPFHALLGKGEAEDVFKEPLKEVVEMFKASAVTFGAGDPYVFTFNERNQRTFIPKPSPRLFKRFEENVLERIIACCDRFFAVAIFTCSWVIKADDSPYR